MFFSLFRLVETSYMQESDVCLPLESHRGKPGNEAVRCWAVQPISSTASGWLSGESDTAPVDGLRQCCSRVPASRTQSCQRFQRLGGQSGAQERHGRRLHAIEQLLLMKSHSMCLFLALQGTMSLYCCVSAGLLARVQATSIFWRASPDRSMSRKTTGDSRTQHADTLSVSGRRVSSCTVVFGIGGETRAAVLGELCTAAGRQCASIITQSIS